MNSTAKKLPSAALATGSRALTTAARRRSSASSSSPVGFGLSARFEKAVSWLQSTPHRPPQQQLQQPLAAALFSTSGPLARISSSKEEEDLYQALTVSFRTRLAEQIHKPEDEYKAVIEHWTAHSQKDALTRQRTRARKERLASAAQHKDIAWIQKEQEKLELQEPHGTADDHFYIIQAWIKCGELKRATMAFERMEAMGIPLTVRTLAAMTRAHARSGSLAVAGAMVQKMQDGNLLPSSIYDLSALLEYHIKMTPAAAFTTGATGIPTSSAPTLDSTSTTSNGTLATSGNTDQNHKRVDSIWKAIEPRMLLGRSATVNNNISFSYRMYLTFLVNKVQNLEQAAELIDKMTARNISPELERYPKTGLAVVQHLLKHGYLTEVQHLMDQNDAALTKILSPAAWGDWMETCMARGEHQKARWIFNDMIRHGVQPTSQCKKMFSELQLEGGTVDRGGPEVSGAGTSRDNASILGMLFNRHPKPALS
ncbi:hypothetical protein BGZ98_001821 [Dissophora globulifera]|nr:hypothetical protein BGZ98_001821 [Dissophora globulifera]